MGQDGEEAAELVATIRGEHVVMKNWFMGPSPEASALRNKYGAYPGLWKEVLNWPGWKEARKAYLQHTQKGEASSSGIPRKRRSRWGSADDTAPAGNDNSHGGQQKTKERPLARFARTSDERTGVSCLSACYFRCMPHTTKWLW